MMSVGGIEPPVRLLSQLRLIVCGLPRTWANRCRLEHMCMCIECETTDTGCFELKLSAGKHIIVQVKTNNGAHVTRARDIYVSPRTGGANITVVRVVAAKFVAIGKGYIRIAAQPAILVCQLVRNLNMKEQSRYEPDKPQKRRSRSRDHQASVDPIFIAELLSRREEKDQGRYYCTSDPNDPVGKYRHYYGKSSHRKSLHKRFLQNGFSETMRFRSAPQAGIIIRTQSGPSVEPGPSATNKLNGEFTWWRGRLPSGVPPCRAGRAGRRASTGGLRRSGPW